MLLVHVSSRHNNIIMCTAEYANSAIIYCQLYSPNFPTPQNENGPCPLLALCNVLILSGRMKIPPGETIVTSTHLLDLLGACLIELHPGDKLSDGERANYEQNVQDAMSIFPKLQTGLDVNVKFNRYTCVLLHCCNSLCSVLAPDSLF